MKKTPMRKCIVSREQFPKNELIRVVLTPDGEVELDLTGRKNGRGAYIQKNKEAILSAQSKGLLNKSLKSKVPNEIYEELLKHVD
ncbi:RNase P modulator RnpM [Erysipelothrix urinaevulpis]|uniref:RNase P modulator RnpM n=1 Tax=Erysipelothrix urinaevulpis TaxID=2683717 RepID=UPI0013567E3C|nr:YlxR family protein [Erysipelothrix urinaevulpis]